MTERDRFRLFIRSASVPKARSLSSSGFSSTLPAIMIRAALVLGLIFAFAVASTKTGYVYLGHCDPKSGWSEDATFDGLPACDGKAGAETIIVARKGMKVRDRLPTDGSYGAESGRVLRGQRVTMRGVVHRKSDGTSWGEIEVN